MIESVQAGYAGLAEVAGKLARFDESALLARIAETQAAFRTTCLEHDRCYEDEVIAHLRLISLQLEHLCFVSAFQRVDWELLIQRLELKIAHEHLSARASRAQFLVLDNSRFHFMGLEDPAMTTMAAIAMGMDDTARWMATEYLYHYDAGELEGSYDEQFLAFCAFVADWHLHSRINATRSARVATGRAYRVLVDPKVEVRAAIDRVMDWRIREARRQLLKDGSQTTNVAGDYYFALFPFEIVGFARLARERNGAMIERAESAPPWLTSAMASGRAASDPFIRAVDQKLQKLEENIERNV
jgi:hypothetical protein